MQTVIQLDFEMCAAVGHAKSQNNGTFPINLLQLNNFPFLVIRRCQQCDSDVDKLVIAANDLSQTDIPLCVQ